MNLSKCIIISLLRLLISAACMEDDGFQNVFTGKLQHTRGFMQLSAESMGFVEMSVRSGRNHHAIGTLTFNIRHAFKKPTHKNAT